MIGELTAYAILFFAWPILRVGQKLHDWWSEPDRTYYRGLWIADHMHPHLIHRLQAGAQSAWIRGAAVTPPASRLTPAPPPSVGAGTQRGSADPPPSVEPQPAPGRSATAPGAGTQLRATSSRPGVRGSAAADSVEPQPTPGLGSPGVGPKPRSTSMTPDFGVGRPQPRNSGEPVGCEPGASIPEVGAPAQGAA
jgi:hypothetical protein